jgi:hypothetical protein
LPNLQTEEEEEEEEEENKIFSCLVCFTFVGMIFDFVDI